MAKKSYRSTTPKGILRFHSYNGDMAGCGYIRIVWPSILLGQFKYKKLTVNSTFGMHAILDANYYNDMQFVKFQRSAEDHQVKLIEYIMNHIKPKTGVKLIYEIDDLLTPDIPKTNYAHEYYAHFWPNIQRIFRMVNGITTSTDSLANIYRQYNDNVTVIPNQIPRFVWGEEEWKNHDNIKPRILYAGSANHFNHDAPGGDFSNELINYIIKTTDKYQWVFVGGVPFELREYCGDKIEYHTWQSIFDLPAKLKSLKIDIALAPLEDNLFNRCKSNIKMLEYAALGIPCIYSNVTPYKKAKLISTTTEEMINHIESLADNPERRKQYWNLSRT